MEVDEYPDILNKLIATNMPNVAKEQIPSSTGSNKKETSKSSSFYNHFFPPSACEVAEGLV